ncbi:MAG: hypothetical protein LBE20_02395 [Deltaproteobacteria bacterium]|jgi:hypothetical protein|nr:hypothetical protein [Deltaproteobacteria bacterium]
MKKKVKILIIVLGLLYILDSSISFGQTSMKNEDAPEITSLKESATDLAVDDEIRKLEMPTFRNIRAIRTELVDNKVQRDDFLDIFKSINGIALLTLNYLDKTVASGLSTQSQITDNKVTQHLLKQISWATHEIARPERKQLYRDFSEKIEFCLAKEEKGKDISKYGEKVGGLVADNEKCKEVCGEKPTDSVTVTDKKKVTIEGKNKGIYDWCICCAELIVKTNRPEEGKGSSQEDEEAISLWDKLITGNKGGTEGDIVTEIKHLRAMYGDILYKEGKVGETGGSGSSGNEGSQKIWTEYPAASIAKMVYAIRDGFEKNEKLTLHEEAKNLLSASLGKSLSKSSGTSGTSTSTSTKDFMGIYTHTVEAIKGWPPKNNGGKIDETYLKHWGYASLGKLLYAYDIEAWLAFTSQRPNNGNWNIDDNANKTIKALVSYWADTAAVSFVRSIHIRNKGRIEDFMTLSNVLSEFEKEKIRNMVNRVEKQFVVVEELAVMERFVENKNIVAGMTQEKDKALAVSTLMMAIGAGIPTDRSTVYGGAVPNIGTD